MGARSGAAEGEREFEHTDAPVDFTGRERSVQEEADLDV